MRPFVDFRGDRGDIWGIAEAPGDSRALQRFCWNLACVRRIKNVTHAQ